MLIGQADFKNNNFDFLRFFAASMVIFDHSFPIYGQRFTDFTLALTGVTGLLALPVFFIISGFLITRSWLRNPKVIPYFKKRILRIFPGLIFAIFLTVFILGPIVTILPIKSYFSQGQTWMYLTSITLKIKAHLPGVFLDNPRAQIINGSLWSLSLEFLMYILVAVFGVTGILHQKRKSLVIGIVILLIIMMEILTRNSTLRSVNIVGLVPFLFVEFGAYFAVGSLFYLYRDHVPLNPLLALLSAFMIFMAIKFPVLASLNYLGLPYLVLYFALAVKIKPLSSFKKYGDFSYGMYIFAFPIQQTIVHFWGRKISFTAFILLAFCATLVMSFFSWNLVEKHALKLKNKSLNIAFPFKEKIAKLFARQDKPARP